MKGRHISEIVDDLYREYSEKLGEGLETTVSVGDRLFLARKLRLGLGAIGMSRDSLETAHLVVWVSMPNDVIGVARAYFSLLAGPRNTGKWSHDEGTFHEDSIVVGFGDFDCLLLSRYPEQARFTALLLAKVSAMFQRGQFETPTWGHLVGRPPLASSS